MATIQESLFYLLLDESTNTCFTFYIRLCVRTRDVTRISRSEWLQELKHIPSVFKREIFATIFATFKKNQLEDFSYATQTIHQNYLGLMQQFNSPHAEILPKFLQCNLTLHREAPSVFFCSQHY